jgi:hypothetical protein
MSTAHEAILKAFWESIPEAVRVRAQLSVWTCCIIKTVEVIVIALLPRLFLGTERAGGNCNGVFAETDG